MGMRRTVLLGALAGAVLAIAGAPREWPLLAFATPPLLLAAIAGEAGDRASAKRGFVAGIAAGTACNAIALYWIVGLLESFARFPLAAAVPVAILLFVAQSATFALAGAAAGALARTSPAFARGLWVWLPVALAASFSITWSLFPWRPSAAVIPWVAWVQAAEIGGEPLLDFAWALAGCGLFAGVRDRRALPFAIGAAALVLPVMYGAIRVDQVREERAHAPLLRVGVVQPNVGIYEKHDETLWMFQLVDLRELTAEVEARGAELVVWPETSYPFPWPRERRVDMPGFQAAIRDEVRGPLLFGAITRRGPCARWNSAIALDRDGRVTGVSDKVELLAFGEYVPLWHVLPPLQARFRCPGLLAGETPETLSIASARIAVLNCYEDVLARYGWRVMQSSPDLLVNVTNDAWFGDTSEPFLHQTVARMRAIETRRDLLRSVNTGVSSHVAATGEVLHATATWQRTAFVAEARILAGRTLWVRLGDVTTPTLLGALLGAALATAARRRRRGAT